MSRWGALCPVPWQSCIPSRQLLGHANQTTIFDFMALCDLTEFKLPPQLGLDCDVLTGTAFPALIAPGMCLYGGVPGEQQSSKGERV